MNEGYSNITDLRKLADKCLRRQKLQNSLFRSATFSFSELLSLSNSIVYSSLFILLHFSFLTVHFYNFHFSNRHLSIRAPDALCRRAVIVSLPIDPSIQFCYFYNKITMKISFQLYDPMKLLLLPQSCLIPLSRHVVISLMQ